MVEKIVDKGSDDMLRCLEIISGSPLTEEELNAKVKSKANTQCPDLANPNYIQVVVVQYQKSVTYKSEPIEKKLVLPETKTLNMRNVDFKVLTRANVEEEFKKIEESGKPNSYIWFTRRTL